MPRAALTGTRIRARRMTLGIRQSDLARQAGISASYLNLIEHNRRRVAAGLLGKLAALLGIDAEALGEGAKSGLMDDLRAAAARVGTDSGEPPELDRLEEFAGRFPGWAALLADVHRRSGALERTVERLSDRMTHDPFLSAALHEIVSAVTAVQSTAAILAETEEIEPAWREKFHQNVHADAVRLADGAEALVNYLDMSEAEDTGLASPQEEVEAWLTTRDFHFPEIEQDPSAPHDALIAGQVELASSAAQVLARRLLETYSRDAAALPLTAFLQALSETGGRAPDLLARRFDVALTAVFRRLAFLPPDTGIPASGLVVCDGSGTLTLRRPLEGFGLPRFGGGCPLWPLYQALARPHQPLRKVIETASRQPRRFVCHAVSHSVSDPDFGGAQVWEAMMLFDPLPAGDPRTVEETVGTSCRICPRGDCPARREPSILERAG